MKRWDWTGRRVSVTAHCEDVRHGVGAHFNVKARFEEEAEEQARRIVEQHHGKLQRVSGGNYRIRFELGH